MTRFAPDALLACRDDARELDPGEIGALLAAELVVCLDDGANRLVEGRAGDATFAASLQLDAAGAVTRCLLFRTPVIEPPPVAPGAGDALDVLDTYFAQLERGRFAAAADCFSEDCLYSHPPYAPGAGRVEFRGREELLAGFVRRGNRPYEHSIAVSLQRGSHCMIEGAATGTSLGGSFVSSLSLDGDGRIRRYAAFYCEPPVPRR